MKRDTNRRAERGIALVITLILLSVTLIMAVAFLAISRRERGSVTTSTDTVTARLAADAALANAQAQIIASVLATNAAAYAPGLLVSTNFVNGYGFVSGVSDPANVNYTYANGNPLNNADFEQNVANLLYLPRAPVFVPNPTNSSGPSDFRFFLDLNRNGQFEANGLVANVDSGNNVIFAGGKAVTNNQTGDPEWVGVLERPDVPHGPNNKFVSRYAFVAVPADSLDLNAIHNQTRNLNLTTSDGYFRNEGVGSWEINLAAFLADLNTNEWGQVIGTSANGNATFYYYQYTPPFNAGAAFDDARSLLSYRYNFNYNNQGLLAPNFYNALVNYGIDEYTLGNLMTSTTLPFVSPPISGINTPWAGADNTNHYFSISSDLFDTTKIMPTNFINHLEVAGNGVSTYDRYTFYRLLAQMGTDSAPEAGKMNLNYDNLDINGNVIPNAETNLIGWTAARFFTNAANRLLVEYSDHWFRADPSNFLATYYGIHTSYTYNDASGTRTEDPTGLGLTNVPYFGLTNRVPAFGITNIPVFINSNFVYSSAVQRVLQLAANIYDASTNRAYGRNNSFLASGIRLPTLFQPIFTRVGNGTSYNVYITGFFEYKGMGSALASQSPLDLDDPVELDNAANWPPYNPIAQGLNGGPPLVYGVPIIVGAKKGLPNFNQFSMESTFQITRKLQVTRGSTNQVTDPVSSYKLNQVFNCSLSNLFAVECWNSYYTNYPLPVTIWVADKIQMMLTNDQPAPPLYIPLNTYLYTSATINNWSGMGTNATVNAGSFQITNFPAIALPPASYLFNTTYNGYRFQPIGTNTTQNFENPSGMVQPRWGLAATNNLQVVIVDNFTGRAIDYVQLRGPKFTRDLTAEISNMTNSAVFWQTNPAASGILPPKSVPQGVEAQLQTSVKYGSLWGQQSQGSVQPQIDGFLAFLHRPPAGYTSAIGSTNLEIQAPYTPTATTVRIVNWQANDPLVHYTAGDLFDPANSTAPLPTPKNPLIDTVLNERYQPWGRAVQMPAGSSWDLALKDPLVWSSDHWNFPTNKFPTSGWLGRVHRGTPWQTVYLKASGVDLSSWENWTGNFNTNDAINAVPAQDRLLFDVFTTAINDNATRGQLSINAAAAPDDPAAGLAAWSAVLSGVTVLSNSTSGGFALTTYHTLNPLRDIPAFTAHPIDPAGPGGAASPLGKLVASINSTRTNTALFAQRVFGTKYGVGDILAAPAFSEQSSFLHLSNFVNSAWVEDTAQKQYGISDEMYEWLPQQTMSLLRVTGTPQSPMRYVIYSYGQTLQPAPNGVVTSGSFFGMVTNYQVVAETVTRSVVRVNPVVTIDANGYHTNYNTKIEQINVLPPD